MNSHISRDLFFRLGYEFDYDTYINSNLLIRGAAAIYEDSGKHMAGFFHLGVRFEVQKFKKTYIRFGIGPTFIWRENWWRVEKGYKGNMFYGNTPHNRKYESAFIFYGGDIEIERRSGKKGYFIGIIPGFPVVVNLTAGVRLY